MKNTIARILFGLFLLVVFILLASFVRIEN
jgi:hypothetical protein